MFLLLLFIILLVYLIMRPSNINIEAYDDLVSNISLDKCAEWCKTTENCYGFAYDAVTKKCYPSYNLLEGKPRDSIYRDFYRPSNTSCNKIQPVVTHKLQNELTLDERRKNSIYICREREDMQPSWYLHQNNRFLNIGSGKNLDEIYNVDVYDVRPYEWSKIKQTSVIDKQNLDQQYNNKTVTNIDRVAQINDILYVLPKPIPPKQNVSYDFGLPNITIF